MKNNFGERDGNFAEKYQLLLTVVPARIGLASTLTSIRNGDSITNVTIQITLKVVLDSGAIQPTPMFDGSGAPRRTAMPAYLGNKCRPWFAVTSTEYPDKCLCFTTLLCAEIKKPYKKSVAGSHFFEKSEVPNQSKSPSVSNRTS